MKTTLDTIIHNRIQILESKYSEYLKSVDTNTNNTIDTEDTTKIEFLKTIPIRLTELYELQYHLDNINIL